MESKIADVIKECFMSNIDNGPYDEKNLIDALFVLTYSLKRISTSIYPDDCGPGRDANGGSVSSLTEAVMGITGGLVKIADSINNLAEAIKEKE